MTNENGQPAKTDMKPWILLALWFAWLGMMAYMGRHEWGVSKAKSQPQQIENGTRE